MSVAARLPFAEIEPRRPKGRPPRARNGGRQGRLADRLGGPGDEVNRVDRPAGGTTCLACLTPHSTFFCSRILHHFVFLLVSLPCTTLHHIRFPSPSLLRFAAATAILSFASSSCVSAQRSDAQMRRVLQAESDLLEKVKDERRHPPLVKKLHSDSLTSDAETHLRDAIDALIKANAELRSALNNR